MWGETKRGLSNTEAFQDLENPILFINHLI